MEPASSVPCSILQAHPRAVSRRRNDSAARSWRPRRCSSESAPSLPRRASHRIHSGLSRPRSNSLRIVHSRNYKRSPPLQRLVCSLEKVAVTCRFARIAKGFRDLQRQKETFQILVGPWRESPMSPPHSSLYFLCINVKLPDSSMWWWYSGFCGRALQSWNTALPTATIVPQ